MTTPRITRVRDRYKLPHATKPLFAGESKDDLPATFAPAFWLVAAHGGAGVSTLEKFWQPAADASRMWPQDEDSTACVVVARSTKAGLEAAAQTILNDTGSAEIIGLVVVADVPGKLPKDLDHKLRMFDEQMPVWRIDYLPKLRLVDEEQLACWRPGDDIDTSRRAKKLGLDEQVPAQVARVGEEIFAAVRERRNQTSAAAD
ncbi:hypothetical protein OS128_00230 [Corynebacterium sp. P5848]|uniref:DUF6668 family protein n=1 Tax=Corynebacterium marambiense TaxID=2765364 RepID=UPI002260F875|nr:DUF6668 family protein [Corynebacterium marambiense]MCX7541345.1 hypothetical protein [Corynebacterium marambiense]